MSTIDATAMTIARQIILFLAAFWLLSCLVSSRLASFSAHRGTHDVRLDVVDHLPLLVHQHRQVLEYLIHLANLLLDLAILLALGDRARCCTPSLPRWT